MLKEFRENLYSFPGNSEFPTFENGSRANAWREEELKKGFEMLQKNLHHLWD